MVKKHKTAVYVQLVMFNQFLPAWEKHKYALGTIRVMFMYLCSIIYVQLISPILGKHKYAWEPLELCLCIYVQLIIPAVFELTLQNNAGASRA